MKACLPAPSISVDSKPGFAMSDTGSALISTKESPSITCINPQRVTVAEIEAVGWHTHVQEVPSPKDQPVRWESIRSPKLGVLVVHLHVNKCRNLDI